jgi:hypothetical protein
MCQKSELLCVASWLKFELPKFAKAKGAKVSKIPINFLFFICQITQMPTPAISCPDCHFSVYCSLAAVIAVKSPIRHPSSCENPLVVWYKLIIDIYNKLSKKY